MPIPIKHLFSENFDIHRQPNEKDMKEMSKGWPNLPIELEELPEIIPPEEGSQRHQIELEKLKNYFFKPVNSQEFLVKSNDKPFSLLAGYCNKHNLNINLEALDKLNDELASLILNLKFKYNRPRPKEYMSRSQNQFPYERIESNKSPSFPSGHAAHAFFNACIVSKFNPDHEMRLRTLAEMIAQSRIDLGKHYPSDVSFGRFLGEYIAKKYLEKIEGDMNLNENYSEDNNEITGRKRLVEYAKRHDEKKIGTTYVDELCEFLIRSNEIERYVVDIKEAEDAAYSFVRGLPVKHCTKNKYIRSHLDAIDAALNIDRVDTPKKVQEIHLALGDDVIERGHAGEFRQYSHYARSTGYPYSEPDQILDDVSAWCDNLNIEPFMRHIIYECIHPFGDGNGRSGRIILLSDLDFDVAKINDLIGDNYIQRLVDYQHASHKIEEDNEN